MFVCFIATIIPLEALTEGVIEVMEVFATVSVGSSEETLNVGGVTERDTIFGERYLGAGGFVLEEDDFEDTREWFKDESSLRRFCP